MKKVLFRPNTARLVSPHSNLFGFGMPLMRDGGSGNGGMAMLHAIVAHNQVRPNSLKNQATSFAGTRRRSGEFMSRTPTRETNITGIARPIGILESGSCFHWTGTSFTRRPSLRTW